jgi:hypothetical protein
MKKISTVRMVRMAVPIPNVGLQQSVVTTLAGAMKK